MSLARPEELGPHLARIAGAWQEIVGDVDHGAMEIFGRVEALARELAALQRDILTKFGPQLRGVHDPRHPAYVVPGLSGSPTELRPGGSVVRGVRGSSPSSRASVPCAATRRGRRTTRTSPSPHAASRSPSGPSSR